jgi:hypothetical protein
MAAKVGYEDWDEGQHIKKNREYKYEEELERK